MTVHRDVDPPPLALPARCSESPGCKIKRWLVQSRANSAAGHDRCGSEVAFRCSRVARGAITAACILEVVEVVFVRHSSRNFALSFHVSVLRGLAGRDEFSFGDAPRVATGDAVNQP